MPASALWLRRPLLNWREVAEWMEAAGVRKAMPPGQLHTTLATVRTPVDWEDLPLETDKVVVPAGPKPVQIFGYTVKALAYEDERLAARQAQLARLLPGMDHHQRYRGHVSLFRGGRMPRSVYQGPLVFGPEIASEFSEQAARDIKHVAVADLLAGTAA